MLPAVISSENIKKCRGNDDFSKLASTGWHSEQSHIHPSSNCSITFEKTPSDYAILKIHTLPESGGDTLWASAYDRLSPEFQNFLERLTAVHDAEHFKVIAER